MKLKLYSLSFIILSIAAVSCKSASKMYEKGNYDEAVQLAAKKLQKDPKDAKLTGIIIDAYRYALNDHQSRIAAYSQSNAELKWESVYREYADLQRLHDAIVKVPSVASVVNPEDYSAEIASAASKAADARYNRGMALMDRGDKQSFRNAYGEFQVAIGYAPGDRDIMDKMAIAYENAATNIVVSPLQQDGGYVYSSYRVGADNLDDQLVRSLQSNSGNAFVKFYSAWDARSNHIRADEILDMQLTTLNLGGFRDFKSTRRVSQEVVIKETVYKKDSVVKEYGKVYADIITTKRSMNSNAQLSVTLRDVNGGWIWSDNFSAVHNWNTEFYSYKGDTRALSAAELQLVNRKEEMPPSQDAVVQCLMEEIRSNALYQVRNLTTRL